jgi:8-oxo-dGTP diphosphatase
MAIPVTPLIAVDCIIEIGGGIVLIERGNEPQGWALPGGFVDKGEALPDACRREMKEETRLSVTLLEQFFTYSNPKRDPRGHTISVIYIGHAQGEPRGADDAKTAKIFNLDRLPSRLAFDHAVIIADYLQYKRTGKKPGAER